MGKHEVVS